MRTLFTLLAALLLAAPAGAADWVRVETPNLIVFGPGEKKTREVAAEFERFREAISQLLPGATIASAVPVTVVVFENDAAFNQFRPKYNGKVVRVGGFYFGTESDNVITFPYGLNSDSGLRIIFHEYTHLITANAARALPPWVSEGLAEFYSTFEIRADGKQALLGQVVPQHVELLSNPNRWLPLPQLLGVTHDSPLYNEGERRSIFYAQSWAMVHMFMTGEPNRAKEFSRYVQLTGGGAAPLDAWKSAFGDIDIQKELQRYLSRFTLRGYRYTFKEGVGPLQAEVRKPTAADVDAVVARLLRYGNEADVEPRLQRAVAATPPSALARALLGFHYANAGRPEEASRLLQDAARDTSDWLVQYYVAAGIDRMDGKPNERELAVARAATEAVVAARPGLAHGHALKARLTDGPGALAAVRQARARAPGREDYTFLEARLRAEARDFPGARTTLAPLMSPNYPPGIREQARSLMGQIVRMEEFFAQRNTRSSPTATPGDSGPATPPRGVQWVFRQVQPGEERIEGLLERIDCARDGSVTFVVSAGGQQKRFVARAFGDLEFITYREQQGGKITCGARQPPDPVYVTWRPAAATTPATAGRPVAIEFLPEK